MKHPNWINQLFFLIIFIPFLAFGQEKGIKNLPQPPKEADCDNYKGYIPYHPEYFPLKKLRLILHIIGKDDGGGNFTGTPKERAYITEVLKVVNWIYSSPEESNAKDVSYRYISSARLQFVIDTIYYYQNSDEYNYKKNCGYYDKTKKDTLQDNGKTWAFTDKIHEKYVVRNGLITPRLKDSALHVFLLEGMPGRGMAHDLYSKKWLNIVGAYHNYKESDGKNAYSTGLVMAHEIGHNLGLNHVFGSKYYPDLVVKEKGQTNNIMDAFPGQSRALSPTQIGFIQWGLAGKRGDMSKIIIRNPCVLNERENIRIQTPDTIKWLGETTLEGNLEILPNSVLVVACTLKMPANGKIIIHPKGHLILNGGAIIPACQESAWKGIYLEKNKRKWFKTKPSRSIFNVYNDGYFSGSEEGILKIDF